MGEGVVVPMASRLGSENFGRGTDPGTRVEGVACAKTTPVTAGTCTFDCMNKAIQRMGFKHKFGLELNRALMH
jgi:hypothetical protein